MPKQLHNKAGKFVAIEFSIDEMALLLNVEPEKLIEWRSVIKPFGRSKSPVYRFAHKSDLRSFVKRLRF